MLTRRIGKNRKGKISGRTLVLLVEIREYIKVLRHGGLSTRFSDAGIYRTLINTTLLAEFFAHGSA